MGNFMVRMGVVIGILATVQLGFLYVGHLTHPPVVEPQQSIESFPMVVNLRDKGTWQGKSAELDSRTFTASEVDSAVSRTYSKDGAEGHRLNFFLAEYKSPRAGLYHNPMNCYRTAEFTQVGPVERKDLHVGNRPDTKISLTTWKNNKGNEQVIVAYWYEVGDHTMFERGDLLKTQWAMRGKSKWPVMFKVLLEMPANDPAGIDQAKVEILAMAQFVREWLGEDSVRPLVD
jgi:Protein of unknown function (DUF3485)